MFENMHANFNVLERVEAYLIFVADAADKVREENILSCGENSDLIWKLLISSEKLFHLGGNIRNYDGQVVHLVWKRSEERFLHVEKNWQISCMGRTAMLSILWIYVLFLSVLKSIMDVCQNSFPRVLICIGERSLCDNQSEGSSSISISYRSFNIPFDPCS